MKYAMIEVPKFKSTEEALAYGRENKGSEVSAHMLRFMYSKKVKESEEFQRRGKLQEGLDCAFESQFYHEALEELKKED